MISLFRKLRAKYLLWVLAWSTLTFGQGSQTVFTGIATASVTTGVFSTKPRNIGQSFHLVQVKVSNIAACTTWLGEIRLEGSFDNSNWQKIGSSLSTIPLNETRFTSASGSFPYLRVNYVSGNTAACSVTVAYSGNVTGSPITNTISPINDQFLFGSVSGNGFGVLTNAGTGIGCAVAGSRLVLYGLWVTNGVATALTTTARIKVINSTTLVSEYNIFLFGLGAGRVLPMDNGPRPIYISSAVPSGQGIDLVFDQAAGDGINVVAVARCE